MVIDLSKKNNTRCNENVLIESLLDRIKGRKPTDSKKSNNKKENFAGKYTVVNVSASNDAIFKKLYFNEALTAEGIHVTEHDLDAVNKWFRENSECTASNINMYVILGDDMNKHYHLTGDNAYKKDFHILCIDWISAGVKNPYKGIWRWFSDVVDNNARREIAKKNPFYAHYYSLYYGNMGYED